MIHILNNFIETEINPITNSFFDDTWIAYCLTESEEYEINVGRKGNSIYTAKVSKHYPNWKMSLCDFIYFNEANHKNIILSATQEDLVKAQQQYAQHTYCDVYLRDHEPKVLIHSTSLDNWRSIKEDRCLKSWNILKKEKSNWELNPIGQILGDPTDFSDYIMFSNGSISSELVVASKQKNRIVNDCNEEYITGVRLYFDAEKIAKDGLLIRDGIHLKVANCLPLYPYLLWAATWENIGLNSNISTPKEFTEISNKVFNAQFNQSI